MNQKVHTEPEPGGQRVTLRSPVKGTTYEGTVVTWHLGDPEVAVDGGPTRMFPRSWVQEVER